MGELRIGTSGWHYPGGRGTWNGIFYPAIRGRARGFDELEYYAEHFDTVEVNSTFYGQPRAPVTRGWADRTPKGFDFSIKLYQKFTHPTLFAKRLSVTLGEGAPISAVSALAQPLPSDLDEFKRGIDPLADGGKLGVLLAQFPASFKNCDAERSYLEELLSAFSGYTVAVELRHKSWSDTLAETLSLLARHDAAFVQIDEPKFQLSIQQNLLPNIGATYYLRLHGRNAAHWWNHEHAEDRYNYHYRPAELQVFSDTISASRELVRKAYLYANNHFSAQSVANAAMIRHQVGDRVKGMYSAAFLERFPDLGRIVKSENGRARTAVIRPRSSDKLFED